MVFIRNNIYLFIRTKYVLSRKKPKGDNESASFFFITIHIET